MRNISFALAAVVLLHACTTKASTFPGNTRVEMRGPEVVATSLLGEPLYRVPMDAATRARLQRDVDSAIATAAARPGDADALIWLGRRHAYLGNYALAIHAFTEGARLHPADARMYRHRGHRYITLRRLDAAISDLERAASLLPAQPDQVEPDGQPNSRNIPIGSLHSNVWYHLALAYYLKGDWNNAIRASRAGIAVSSNPDRLVSQTHWLYMALRRAGRHDEAARALDPIRDDFDVIENGSYYALVKGYKRGITTAFLDSVVSTGLATSSELSIAYGAANWFLYTGDTTRAVRAFEQILNSPQWPAFGYVAAEADLARLRSRR